MSEALLARLKVKNQATRPEEIAVQFRPPARHEDVVIKAQVIDKRKEAGIDRAQFLNTIANGRKIERKGVPPPHEVVMIEKPEVEEAKIEKPKRKPRKLKKKLKLLDDDSLPSLPQRKSPIGVARIADAQLVQIGKTPIDNRIKKKTDPVAVRASAYYLNNRQIFVNFISSLFAPYKSELAAAALTASCEQRQGEAFSLMGHQKIVRDYLNLYTPYRGLLLYHGLGSGKTCSSIAIAEGMKGERKVIVMTPASLRRNYYEELKKCGDSLYRKNQHWEFVKVTGENIATLSSVLNLSVEYIKSKGGAWLVDISKPTNFSSLDNEQKKSLDKQLDEMIRYKYQFISYNGLLKTHMKELTTGPNGKYNPFDNAVVIIDEAHNLVSMIVNKLTRRDEDSTSMQLYDLLMNADNAKIVLLSGTPIINYPNEIGILFNILRGYIKTWFFKLDINTERRITKDTFTQIFKSTQLGGNVMDYIDYNASNTTLTITRNPFGFVNKTSKGAYDGVRVGERGEMSDDDFVGHVTRLLVNERLKVANVRYENYKALPDTLDDFKAKFVDSENEVQNMGLFKRRIMGLASYFRSAQENLMPRYSKGENFHIERIDMSDFQFGVYEEARVQERKTEMNNAKKRKRNANVNGIYEDTTSTYRIFSRAFCNYVFPRSEIRRPLPGDDLDDLTSQNTKNLAITADEDILDAETPGENIDGKYEAQDLVDVQASSDKSDYDDRIADALAQLESRKEEFLSPEALKTFSPKFLAILQNIKNPEHKGLNLVYSQFRTLEGIGIFGLVLKANGFAEFRIKQVGGNWTLDIPLEDMGKPMFALYTGTETPEQKEIVRNIFNGDWSYIPPSLESQVRRISGNNLYGEVIKVFMITASGAEGISLKNTRYVHIVEPYWHPVRTNQVIGRARRICSHQELPESLRTVDVFLYLMQFSKKQLESEATIELRLKDVSKLDATRPITSDEALYEIATLKEEVTDKLLHAVKEASVDCALHTTAEGPEKLQCLTFGSIDPDAFSYAGSYTDEDTDAIAQQNQRTDKINAVEVTFDGIKYFYDRRSNALYEYESFKRGQAVQIGTMKKRDGSYEISFV